MQLRNTTARWGSLAQLLHWLIVVLVIAQVALASLAADLPLGLKKPVGITILALVLARLAWRSFNPTPALPSTLRPYEKVLAHGTHAALYVLLILLPLSGWIMSSARNFAVSWFNLLQLPNLVAPNQRLYQAMISTHHVLAWILGGIVTLHVLAALKHHFVLKDDVLRRMLP